MAPMKATGMKAAMKAKKVSVMKKSMKAMKAMKKPMKAMKVMKKAKRVSIIAKGKRSKLAVFSGKKTKTQSGLTANDLFKNKRGKVVTKKQYEKGVALYKSGPGKKWIAAVGKARHALGVKGFLAIGGKTQAGQKLLAKARSFYKK